jgi:hypothetical protein
MFCFILKQCAPNNGFVLGKKNTFLAWHKVDAPLFLVVPISSDVHALPPS